jgi:hypothetical protein
MGLAFEFAVAPALSIAMRGAIRGLSKLTASAKDVAEVLMKEMTAEELEQTVKEALPKVESAVANTMKAEKASFVREFMDALKKHLDEVIAHAKAVSEPKGAFAKLKAEWTSRAVKELFEHAKIPVGPNASTALDQLIRKVSTEEMNDILQTVLRGKGVRGLLERYPDGAVALLQMYRGGSAELESLIVSLEHVGADEAQSVLSALVRMQRLSQADRTIISWLAGTAPKQLAAFLRAAEEQEFRSFLGFLTKNPGTRNTLAATLLEQGARQPRRLAAVTKLLGERLAAGEATEAAAVRDLFTLSEDALAEESRLVKQRALRKGATPDQAAKSLEKGERFGERKKANEGLHADEKRVAEDLEKARIEKERYRDMKTGDPARGGQRRPLAFETWEEYDQFAKEFEAMVRGLRKGEPVTAQGQVIGSSTSFYSGNPDKPLGHFYDRKAPRNTGDLDVDVFCPELVKDMLEGAPAVNEKILVDGERTIFKNDGTAANPGFHDKFPEVAKFAKRWEDRLGREVDVKLRLDLELPPVPKAGPIEVFRTGPSSATPAPKAPEPPNRD